ncbi:MAG: hypothetical protein D6741_04695 [Planctomycetota bacterium]|nr:MAG: hypothetical protein D6741_04695 [Planctomycetota bacterium]
MRRRTGPTVSLFSFQDIVTSVMGILLFVALLLALKLFQCSVQAAQTASVDIEALQREIAELERDIEAQEAHINRLAQAQLDVQTIDAEQMERLAQRVENLERRAEELLEQVADLRQEYQETAQATARFAEAAEQELKDLDAQLRELNGLVARFSNGDLTVFNVAGFETHVRYVLDMGQQVWIVTRLDSAGNAAENFSFTGSPGERMRRAVEWIRTLPRRSYVFLLIRPSMQNYGWDLNEKLREIGLPHGFEPIGESLEVTFAPPVEP